MAEQAEKTEEQTNGGAEGNGGHKAVRAAAIAAATGATALAAKKAFSGKSEDDDEPKQKPKRSEKRSGDDSMLSEMLTSGWDAAKDSLLPFAEDAAGAAGEWVARNTPELVSDTLVPRFIRGFERARKSSDDEGGDSEEAKS
jgi:hypothetical protein